jgi:uncharacterized protein YdaU (DUF1376 family)
VGYNGEDKSGRSAAETAGVAPDHINPKEVDMAKPQSIPPAFQLYAAEFVAGDKVSRMSYTEIGIFIVLLCHAWLGRGLPISVIEISKKLKINPSRFAKIWRGVLSECWVERGGRLVNPKQEEIRRQNSDYRKKQADRATKGWQSRGNAAAVQPVQPSGNALHLQSSSSSSERTHRQGGAPLHQSHRSHASCGRVCVPADLHVQFVKARNHDGADKELRDWYGAIDHDWSVGEHRDTNPGGNDFKFWRARFDEKWPAPVVSKSKSPWAGWTPKAGAQ